MAAKFYWHYNIFQKFMKVLQSANISLLRGVVRIFREKGGGVSNFLYEKFKPELFPSKTLAN